MQDLGFRVWDLGCRMQDSGFRVRDFRSFVFESVAPRARNCLEPEPQFLTQGSPQKSLKPKRQQAPWFGVFWGKGAYCRKEIPEALDP